jgi:hypothetical protein
VNGLELGLLFGVLLVRDRELGPSVEDRAVAAPWDAHELGLEGPRHGRTAVLGQDLVGAEAIDILGVEEETVHVK